MNDYESLVDRISEEFPIVEDTLEDVKDDAYYCRGVIFINPNLTTITKKEHLYEEYCHAKYTVGTIVNQEIPSNHKQELFARKKALLSAVTLDTLIDCYNQNIVEYWEASEYLGLSQEFLRNAVQEIKKVYGLIIEYKDYILQFINDTALKVEKRKARTTNTD